MARLTNIKRNIPCLVFPGGAILYNDGLRWPEVLNAHFELGFALCQTTSRNIQQLSSQCAISLNLPLSILNCPKKENQNHGLLYKLQEL